MSCTNPNCECKPGTFANMNPPRALVYEGFGQFNPQMITDLEWQKKVSVNTASGKYRVEIRWALDCYDIYVWRRVQEPERVVAYHYANYSRTAVKTANRLLRHYGRSY
jgi:hypothetical protein